jgi:hypothetical protein
VRYFRLSFALLCSCAIAGCGSQSSSTSLVPQAARVSGSQPAAMTPGMAFAALRTAQSAQSYTALVAASDPLAYYKLNDTSTTMTDSGPHGVSGVYGSGVHHGGAPLTSADNASSSFPGGAPGENIPANTGTTAANSIFNSASTSLTVEAWINMAKYNSTNTYVPVVSYGRGGIGSVWALQITPQSTLAFYFKVNGGRGSYLIESLQLLPAQVYQVVATYNGSTASVYINGELATSISASGSLNYSGYPPQYGLTMGGAAGSNSPVFGGTINDVSIFPSALSASTIENHYVAGRIIAALDEQPGESDSFVNTIGVVTHLRETGPYTQSFPTFKSLIEASGIRHIGDSLTTDPAFYMQEINELAAVGIHASLITAPTQTSRTIAATIPAFANAIEAVEGLNEPDISGNPNWVADTRSFQSMLYSTVKGNPATKSLPVLGPSITSVANQLALGNLSSSLDYGSMHDYFDGYNPGTVGWGSLGPYGVYGSLAYNCNIVGIVSGSKPLYSTETGYGNSPDDSGGVDNQTLAKYVPRLYLEHYLKGIARTTLYEFYDEPGNGDFDDYGLVEQNNTPKPSYYALKSLIGALADPGPTFTTKKLSYVLSGNMDNVQHLSLQKRNGAYELVLWVETESYNPTTKTDITVPAQTISLAPTGSPGSGTISVIGDSGNVTTSPLSFTNGVASFSVNDHVTIVSFE